ncbi:hypothetical protein Tco_1387091 [Tanacetum coccineum]
MGKVQLQAIVHEKKIIITEASVRRDLQLNDEEGMDCLPNATIFEEFIRIGVESSKDEGLGEEDASKQGRIADIDADAGINLVSTHFDVDTDMFGVHDLVCDEAVVETEVASKDVNLSVDEVTLAQALAAFKSTKPKADKVMLQEPEQEEQATTPKVSSQQPSQVNVQDKVKGKMVEPEKPIKKKELIRLDEEIASKLQTASLIGSINELQRECEKGRAKHCFHRDNVQAMIDVDYQMAQ